MTTTYTCYHGGAGPIESFDPEYLGHGNDQYGSGFYFSTSKDIAKSYCSGSTPTVVTAEVTLKNPIIIDGMKNANLSCVPVCLPQSKEILRCDTDLYLQPDSEEFCNPLGDYAPEFWDQEHFELEDFQYMIDRMAEEYFAETDLKMLDIFFGSNAMDLHKGIQQVLGYDGIIVNFSDSQHVIAWFPEQIHVVANEKGADIA